MAETRRVPRACELCGAAFYALVALVRRGKGRFCSKRCAANARLGGPQEQRFWSRVEKTEGCWLWVGNRGRNGYGTVGWNGVYTSAHRVAWVLAHGPIPDGLEVCHDCPGGDNRLCVNPDHLFVGTHTENMQDAKAKGRTTQGGRNVNARLREDDVREIVRRYLAGEDAAAIAAAFGTSTTEPYRLAAGLRWGHIWTADELEENRRACRVRGDDKTKRAWLARRRARLLATPVCAGA